MHLTKYYEAGLEPTFSGSKVASLTIEPDRFFAFPFRFKIQIALGFYYNAGQAELTRALQGILVPASVRQVLAIKRTSFENKRA